jgi:hypothetical protein
MVSITENQNKLNKTNWFFIILGMLEVFILVFLTQNFLTVFYGLITLIPAYIALNENRIKWNYFVGIWTLIQFNPITILAMIAFLLGDFLKTGADRSVGSLDTILAVFLMLTFITIAITSFVLGIKLISRTSKHCKLIKSVTISE